MVKPINQLYNNLNNLEKLRVVNEKRRDSALRRNAIGTAIKGFAVYSAIPFASGAVLLSGMDSEYRTVTYKIPEILKKSKTLENIGLKIIKGFYKGVEKTSEFLKNPKYQQMIEKTDEFVGNVSKKVFKQDNELTDVKGAMTSKGIFAVGTALLGLTAVKHLVNRHKINSEYHKKQEQISRYQFRAVSDQISEIQNTNKNRDF